MVYANYHSKYTADKLMTFIPASRAGFSQSGFDDFDSLGTITPTGSGTVSSVVSNTLTFATGDLLMVFAGASRDSLPTANVPTGNWTSPPTFVEEYADGHNPSSLASLLSLHIVTADSGQTAEDVTQTWSGSVYNPVVGFLNIARGAVLVRKSASAQKGVTGTTLTADLGAVPASNSLCLLHWHHRSSTDPSLPSGWTAIYNTSPGSNSRSGLAWRIGGIQTAEMTGFLAGQPATLRYSEWTRP